MIILVKAAYLRWLLKGYKGFFSFRNEAIHELF